MTDTVAGTMQTIVGGGGGGTPFGAEYPRSVGMRGDVYVDALILNGNIHGGVGGKNPTIVELTEDDYWDSFTIHGGRYVDNLSLHSQKGNTIDAGGSGGNQTVTKSGIRIISIGGSSGRYLDQVAIKFVENYQPSKLLVKGAQAVYKALNGTITVIDEESSDTSMLEAYENVTQHMSEFNVTASVEAEYYAKVSASTSLTLTDSSVTTIQKTIDQNLSKRVKSTLNLSADEARILVGTIDIWQDSQGNTWYTPTAAPDWAVKNSSNFGDLIKYYDLSQNVSTVTGLRRLLDPTTGLYVLRPRI